MLVLLPEAEADRVAELQAAARAADMPMVGAIFPALVADEGFRTEGAWLLRFRRMPPHGLVDALTGPAESAAQRLAAALPSPPRENGRRVPTFFLLFDGMLPNLATLLAALQPHVRELGHLGGVNAGTERFQPYACLFDRERRISGGAVALWLDAEHEVVGRHGYPVSAALLQATSTEGNRISTIDGRPAFGVYQEVVLAEYGVTLTRENFYDHAVHYPFGVVTALDVMVRIPVSYDDAGALTCIGEVPPGCRLRLLRAPAAGDPACVDALVRALPPRGEAPALLTFYCAGRRLHFGGAASHELADLRRATGSPVLAGALTLGEIDESPELGLPRFNNAMILCVR